MSETISVHNMFSPCSAKRRASDKDLPVILGISILCCILSLGAASNRINLETIINR
jgi:hypothetical protein